MFQLKRKSFFRYYAESIEEMVVKRPRTDSSFISDESMLKHSVVQKTISPKPHIGTHEMENDYCSEVRNTRFLNFKADVENEPKKKENKIMKLLKFKNKRENFQNKVPVNVLSANTITPIKKEVVENHKEFVENHHEDDDSLSSSHLAQTEPVNNYEKITIKSEPVDPDFDPPVNIPDVPDEYVPPAASPPKAKRKKNSLGALAKVNPKYIGITGNYICTECPYSSEYITHFERHVKSFHPQLSLYQCEICQFQSKSKSYLTVHTMNHLGLKPYKCTMCDYASPRKDYVNMHMKSHTKEESHFCEFCDYRTYRQDYFNRHLLEKHYKKVF